MSNNPFIQFALTQGVSIDADRLQTDGRIHRADVGEETSGKGDAAYLLREDGSGWITNFKADGKPVHFRPELARELTQEELAKIDEQRQEWRKQQAERQLLAVKDGIQRWEESHDPPAFPYLQVPKLDPAGLRQGRAQLLVPMLGIESDGEPSWVGMQRISWAEPGQSADKRFISGTPTKGAFAVIPIAGTDVEAPLRAYEAACAAEQVVFCEGIGTALAIHQATGLPVIAAMSAQNLPDVARSLHDKLQGRSVIYADNDGEKANFKGQAYAVRAARILGGARTRIALPEKPGGITPPGYDARDQLRDNGNEAIRDTMASTLDAWQMERRLPPEVLASKTRITRTTNLNQEQPMSEKTFLAEIEAQIKDAAKSHNDLTKAANASPAEKKASRDRISALKATRAQMLRATTPSNQTEAQESVSQPASEPATSGGDQGVSKEAAQPAAQDLAAGTAAVASPVTVTPDELLMKEFAALADPVRAQRAKSQYDLNAKHREQREALFGSLDQLRADKMREFNGMANEHQQSLIALGVAKAIEALQKQQAADRKNLQADLPEIPSYRNFLEDRAKTNPVAARMLEEDRGRAQIPVAIQGKRVAAVEPAVLEGLTHETEDGPAGKAIHYARDGERVMSDRGERVDLYKMDDREIEAALRLAEQKYDMDKGLVLTGSREFQQRAAEVAGRMGLKIQNDDLRKAWEQGRSTALQNDDATGTASPLGGITNSPLAKTLEPTTPPTYLIDKNYLTGEAVLGHLPAPAWDALEAAGKGQPLTAEQKALLEDPARNVLIDSDGKLNEIGQLAYDRMQTRAGQERELLQQQLRTRNIDEDLEKKDSEKGQQQIAELQKKASHALEHAIEAAGFSVSGPTDIRAAENNEPVWVCNARAAIAAGYSVPVDQGLGKSGAEKALQPSAELQKESSHALVQAIEAAGYSVSGPTDVSAAENNEPAWVCDGRAVIAEVSSAATDADPQQEIEEKQIKVPAPTLPTRNQSRDMGRGM